MRLIDAEALEEEIVKTGRYVPKDAVLDAACMVNRAPTVEAKPVVHAHWEYPEKAKAKRFIGAQIVKCFSPERETSAKSAVLKWTRRFPDEQKHYS